MSNAMLRRDAPPQASQACSDRRPDESCCPSRARPIDLVHLARQTCGDRDLEREVLALMARQIATVGSRLDLATYEERTQIVHAAKGAARSIGAFPLADAAERLEADFSVEARQLFDIELARAAEFIAAICS